MKRKMAKLGNSSKRKRNNDSQVDLEAAAPVPVPGANPTLAACTSRLRPRTRTRRTVAVVGNYNSAANSSLSSSIPKEIMFNILLLVPASILQEVARFVCKEWNDIITDPLFIKLHLLRWLSLSSSSSSPATAFLIQDPSNVNPNLHEVVYVHPNSSAHAANTHYDYTLTQLMLPFRASVLGSCNGLLLLHHSTPESVSRAFSLFNPVTKANLCLPPFNPRVIVVGKPSAALAFVPCSAHYKVVYASCVSKVGRPAPFVDLRRSPNIHPRAYKVKIMVCTIGVDNTWRDIDCQGITMMSQPDANDTLMSQPFSSSSGAAGGGGYIYWFNKDLLYGFALDVDAETMYQFSGPKDRVLDGEIGCYGAKMMDNGGVCMMQLYPPDKCCWKVWEMTEPKTGTWVRTMDLDASPMYSKLDAHFDTSTVGASVPLVLSLKTGDLWFLCVRVFEKGFCYSFVCYNWKTGNLWSPPLVKWSCWRARPHLHISSLLSPNNL